MKEEIISEPLIYYGLMSKEDVFKKVREFIELIQHDPTLINRYPHEF